MRDQLALSWLRMTSHNGSPRSAPGTFYESPREVGVRRGERASGDGGRKPFVPARAGETSPCGRMKSFLYTPCIFHR